MKVIEAGNVRVYDQHQGLLFPPHLRDKIADDHICLVIDDVVAAMDLSCLYAKVSSQGNPAYHPAMMLKIIFYAYATGVFSSRKIAKAVRENVPFIYLAGWQQPDFRTISDFRKNNLDELKDLFGQIVKICQHLEMVQLGHIAIDGTKIKANAAKSKTYDGKGLERRIERLLQQAEAKDDQEDKELGPDKTGDELPKHIRNREKRIKKLKELSQQLKQQGRKKINTTDPDAVFMKTTDGLKTAYNAQAAVDEANQVIVAAGVTNQPADTQQLMPMIDQSQQNTSGSIDCVSADSGYSSGNNLQDIESRNMDGYIPDCEHQGKIRGKIGPFHKYNFVYDDKDDVFICPQGKKLHFSYYQKRKGKSALRMYQCFAGADCPFFDQCTTNKKGRTVCLHPQEKLLKAMRNKLDTPNGKAIYSRRKVIVEPVFGQIKKAMGFTCFMLRGLFKVNAEFKLVAIAHNLRKIARLVQSKGKQCLSQLKAGPATA